MTMRQIALCAALLAGVGVMPHAAGAQTNDHLTCFGVKDSAPRAKYQATLTTGAGSQSCIVKTPAKVACVPTTKSNVTPTPPGGGPSNSATGAFLCYRAKCPKSSVSENANDQFGNRVILVKASRFLCVPADVAPPAPGLPTSTTTTLPGGPNPCEFRDGQCRGTCAAGKRCGTAVGSASCECRDVACGDADAPECNGACSDPNEACVFSVTDCSCVRVP
jgi:hypothetical protein